MSINKVRKSKVIALSLKLDQLRQLRDHAQDANHGTMTQAIHMEQFKASAAAFVFDNLSVLVECLTLDDEETGAKEEPV